MSSAGRADPAVAFRLVRKATSEGANHDEEAGWRALKNFARSSDGHMEAVFDAVWEQLGAAHSQARFRALELSARLWPRSATFRHALLRDVPGFIRLVFGRSSRQPGQGGAPHGLPPPQKWASKLHHRSAEIILEWHKSHGHLPEYRHLDLARRHVLADIGEVSGSTAAAEEDTTNEPRSQHWRDRWEKLLTSHSDAFVELEAFLSQMRAVLEMLAPSMDEALLARHPSHGIAQQGEAENDASLSDTGEMGLAHVYCGMVDSMDEGEDVVDRGQGNAGLPRESMVAERLEQEGTKDDYGSPSEQSLDDQDEQSSLDHVYHHLPLVHGSIQIQLDQPEGPDGSRQALTDSLRDFYREAQGRFSPTLRSWLATLTHVQLEGEHEQRARTRLLHRVTEARGTLLEAVERAGDLLGYRETEVYGNQSTRCGATQAVSPGQVIDETAQVGDDDSDFEDVHLVPIPSFASWGHPATRTSALSLQTPDAIHQAHDQAAKASPSQHLAEPRPVCRTGDGNSTICGMPRRDGSCCTVVIESEGFCTFHGAVCPRDEYGIPFRGDTLKSPAGCATSALLNSAEGVVDAVVSTQDVKLPCMATCLETAVGHTNAPGDSDNAECAAASKNSSRRRRRTDRQIDGLEEVSRPSQQPKLQARLGKRKAGVVDRRTEAARQANAAARSRQFNSAFSLSG